jgi:HD superfamily phosphodiesterase
MEEKIKRIYNEVYTFFPEYKGEKYNLYRRRDWIFPHHIDLMLDMAKELCLKYNGELIICQLGIILHDTGLVYKRESASAKGHEKRSLEYSKLILKKHKLDNKTITRVLDCIKATELGYTPKNTEEKIVRTVDALSQFKSIHFIAKGVFLGDFDKYLPWLRNKILKSFDKICFEDEKKEVESIRNYFINAFKLYDKMKDLKK